MEKTDILRALVNREKLNGIYSVLYDLVFSSVWAENKQFRLTQCQLNYRNLCVEKKIPVISSRRIRVLLSIVVVQHVSNDSIYQNIILT